MLKTVWSKIKAEPVRALTWTLSAAIAALAFAGVDSGPVYQTLGEILVLVVGGEKARSKVSPV